MHNQLMDGNRSVHVVSSLSAGRYLVSAPAHVKRRGRRIKGRIKGRHTSHRFSNCLCCCSPVPSPHTPSPKPHSPSTSSMLKLTPPRYAQQQQIYNAQAQAAAAAAVQRGNQQLQQQVQQQAQQQAQAAQQSHLQQQQNLLGLINRNSGNVSAGLVGRAINIGPGAVQGLGLDGRPIPQTAAETQIRDVWAEDLNREMGVLRSLVDKFPYIAMVS